MYNLCQSAKSKKHSLWGFSDPVCKRVAVGCGVMMIVLAFVLLPTGTETAQAAGWCSKNASWAGQRGWDRWGNPNFMVDFNIDAGRHTYYIYYNSSYVGADVVGVRNYSPNTNTTQFGVSTWWALRPRNWGWKNTSHWRIDYNC